MMRNEKNADKTDDDPSRGVAGNLYGGEDIRAYRLQCAPVNPGRAIARTVVTSFGSGFGTANVEFSAPDSNRTDRQMQKWVRFPQGWRIVAAHVSHI